MTARVLCFGDSNTWGYIPGAAGHPRLDFDERWPGVLTRLSGVEAVEAGLCGRTAWFDDPRIPGRNGLAALPGILAESGSLDFAVVMLGTNDCKTCYHATPELIGEGLERCLDLIAERVPAPGILLVSPVFLGTDVWHPDKDPDFSPASVELCRKLPQTYSAIAARRGHRFLAASDYTEAGCWDLEHLDTAGHFRLGQAISAELNRMIPDFPEF
ncbi:GDSL-type esterase/lipase family protein [Succinimonas amylolytica]|uniref:GDSL-type esterase/lipase family protein n=1 Tax=Succinimonas amylolytica TaxID=83769 RepID=UPI0023A807BB